MSNSTEQYINQLTTWQATMEANLKTRDGWLSVVGLDWLNEGKNTIGSDLSNDVVFPAGSTPEFVGFLTLDNGKVTLTVTTSEAVFVNDEPVKTADVQDDNTGISTVKIREVTFTVLKRGDAYGVRTRDPQSPARSSFTGRKWFPINPAYRLQATFHPYDDVKSIEVDNILGTQTALKGLGYITFELDGEARQFIAFEGGAKQLWLIFRDTSSGQETYGSGRFLMADILEDGTVDLDFNKAYNPPCAFTPYATCPLPPRENHLPVALRVGEKLP